MTHHHAKLTEEVGDEGGAPGRIEIEPRSVLKGSEGTAIVDPAPRRVDEERPDETDDHHEEERQSG